MDAPFLDILPLVWVQGLVALKEMDSPKYFILFLFLSIVYIHILVILVSGVYCRDLVFFYLAL